MTSHQLLRSGLGSLLAMALAGVLVWPDRVIAQSQPSLAEIARKEAERRKTAKDSKKVITSKDLPESARKPAVAPTTAQGGTAAPAGGEQKPATSGDTAPSAQGDEASWRARMMQAREGLRRNEAFLQALEIQVNALTNDFRNGAGNFPQQAQVTEERRKALDELQRVKADVELSKKQIADIEEEARKAGVPPGWLR